MTAIDIMAAQLDQELQDRGIFGVGRAECATIIRNVIDHASEVAEKAGERPQREMGETP